MAPPVVGQDESPRFWAKSAAGQFARGDQNSGERASPASPGVLRPEPPHTPVGERPQQESEIFIGFAFGIGAVELFDWRAIEGKAELNFRKKRLR